MNITNYSSKNPNSINIVSARIIKANKGSGSRGKSNKGAEKIHLSLEQNTRPFGEVAKLQLEQNN